MDTPKRRRGRPPKDPEAQALALSIRTARPSISCRGLVLQLAARGHKVSAMTVHRWLTSPANEPIFDTEKLA